jgi:parallel beta-helix repeat protein
VAKKIIPFVAGAVLLGIIFAVYYVTVAMVSPSVDAPNGKVVHAVYADDTGNKTRIQISTITPQRQLNISTLEGVDLGEKINKADGECGNVICQINVDEVGVISTPIVLSDNRILKFGPGNYSVSATIRPGNNNEIIGSNATEDSAATVFIRDPKFFAGVGADERVSPPANFNNIAAADMFKVADKTNVVLRDFEIDGSTTAIGYYLIEGVTPKPTGKLFQMPKGKQSEITLTDSSNILISGLRIRGVQIHAVGGAGINGLVIKDSDFSSNGWNKYQLLWLGQEENMNILIQNNLIRNSSHAGLYLEYTSDAVIEKNVFDHNRVNTFFTGPGGQIGLQVHTHGIIIRNNTIINAGYIHADEVPKRDKALLGHGIEVHGYNTTIVNNTISANAGFGISLKNNQEFTSVASGDVLPAHDILIQGNTIIGNGFATGIDVPINKEAAIYDIIIKGNEIDQAPPMDVLSVPDN